MDHQTLVVVVAVECAICQLRLVVRHPPHKWGIPVRFWELVPKMTTTDLLCQWLNERDIIYDIIKPIGGIKAAAVFTVFVKSTIGIGIARLWIMVAPSPKRDPLEAFILMLNREDGCNRRLNFGDPDFFTTIENILRGVGTLEGPTVLKTVRLGN